MKKHYIILIFATISIILLQAWYVKSQHEVYLLTEIKKIEDVLTRSISLELHTRGVKNKKGVTYERVLIPMETMPKKMRDSILAIHPIPKEKFKRTQNVNDLINEGIVESHDQILSSMAQDKYYKKNKPINLNVLDSIFNARMKCDGCKYKFTVTDKSGNILSTIGSDDVKFNYTSGLMQIGLLGYQFLKLEAYIPTSKFISQSIVALVLSVAMILFHLGFLISLLIIVKRKTTQLEEGERNINGTIHDLKTPLSSVTLMLDWILESERSPEMRKHIENSINSVTNLTRNIESLLSAIRHDKKKMTISKERMTGEMLENIVEIIKNDLGFIYPKKINFVEVVNNIDMNANLYIDIMHFENIVRNLVDNALKYSYNYVNISITMEMVSKSKLRIVIKDNGWGVDKKYVKKLFKQFFRIPRDGVIVKGYGIGLAYVKHVVTAHGGSISVTSVINEGSEFEVNLNVENNLE